MFYYRKYLMNDLSLLNEITQSIVSPSGEVTWGYTQTVYVIGPICEQWVTGSTPEGYSYLSCSLYTTASAVDILWNQEPLLSFSSSEVWPQPSQELHTFGNTLSIYQRDYCERFECPTGSLPTGSQYL
jgi:hypothetical protein